ncbi:hypothetical protein HispidOSU_019982 [Sigmodon hispidus]
MAGAAGGLRLAPRLTSERAPRRTERGSRTPPLVAIGRSDRGSLPAAPSRAFLAWLLAEVRGARKASSAAPKLAGSGAR